MDPLTKLTIATAMSVICFITVMTGYMARAVAQDKPDTEISSSIENLANLRDWKYRRTISLQPATVEPDMVVLIEPAPGIANPLYGRTNADGSDLRFASMDGQSLNYWVESWDKNGISRIWVEVKQPGTDRIHVYYGNPAAESLSDGEGLFEFFDDFDNGIWTKPVDHPVYTPSQDRNRPDAHRQVRGILCEPSVLVEDGIFKMWYRSGEGPWAGQKKLLKNGLGYATSKDGVHWNRYPVNPVITEVLPDCVTVMYVMKHNGTYYLFACDSEPTPRTIRQWTSTDGIDWTARGKVLTPPKEEKTKYGNPCIFVDDDGIWKMFLGPLSNPTLATSKDGLHWAESATPVGIPPGGGDPFIRKIGDTYFNWHSEGRGSVVGLCVSVQQSKDMIHWQRNGLKNPQIAHTQAWEKGLGTADVQCARSIADTHIVEHADKLWLYYCGTQSQIGLAVFDGTWEDLGDRILHDPPLAKWDQNSFFGSVVGKQLRMVEDSRALPLIVDSVALSDSKGYIFEFKARKYAGPSYQIMPVVRYVDQTAFAQLWIYDTTTTWYHEHRAPGLPPDGYFQWPLGTINIGANNICDEEWHDWKVVVKGAKNTLYLDGRLIGSVKSIPELVNRNDLKIGFSAYDTFAAFDNVRVRKYSEIEVGCTVSATEERQPTAGSWPAGSK